MISVNVNVEIDEKNAGFDLSITNPATRQSASQIGGVDSVEIGIWASMSEQAFNELDERLAETRKAAFNHPKRERQFCKVGRSERPIAVGATGSSYGCGYSYICEIDGATFLINKRCDGEGRNANVVVKAMGGVMLRFAWNLRAVWSWAERVLEDMGYVVQKHSLSRLDIFGDLVGLPSWKLCKPVDAGYLITRAKDRPGFRDEDEQNLIECVDSAVNAGREAALKAVNDHFDAMQQVGRAAALAARKAGEYSLGTFGGGKSGRGVQVGKGDVVLRIYDKIDQIKKKCDERLLVMRDAWGAGEKTPVTRVEFQLRGSALKRMGVKTVDDWEECQASIVEYLTNKWCFLTAKKPDRKNRNQARSEAHQQWRRVQAVFRQIFARGFRTLQPAEVAPDIRTGRRLAKTGVSFLRNAAVRIWGPVANEWSFRHTLQQLMDETVCLYGPGYQEFTEEATRKFATMRLKSGFSISETLRPDCEVFPHLVRKKLLVEVAAPQVASPVFKCQALPF